MKPSIQFVFSIGHRCYSTDFLNHFKLRKMSSPFDYLFVDFETALKVIHNKFDDFLHDIVYFNKNMQRVELFYKKNTEKIDDRFYELLQNDIGYMADNYNNNNMLFNQNYLHHDTMNHNLYDWNTICGFHHHNILDRSIYDMINRRCERFNTVMNKYDETTCLFYITRIINCEHIADYMKNIIELKKKYNMRCFVIIIMNCNTNEESEYYNEEEKSLFVVKKVENYEIQYHKYKTDNNFNYTQEFNVISKYFDFNLIEKNDI